MKRLLLDTNVLINLQRQLSYMTQEVLLPFQDYQFCISVATYCEFLGAEKMRRKSEAKKFLKSFITLDFDTKCISALSTICSKTEIGTGKTSDILIAATGIGHKMTLLTSNKKDFVNLKGVKVVFYKQP